jgi:hypothetical protein
MIGLEISDFANANGRKTRKVDATIEDLEIGGTPIELDKTLACPSVRLVCSCCIVRGVRLRGKQFDGRTTF